MTKNEEQILADASALIDAVAADPGPRPSFVEVSPECAEVLEVLNKAHERGDIVQGVEAMSPAQLIIDTRERVYQHIRDSPDGLTAEGVLAQMPGRPRWLINACIGYLLGQARAIDTSDDARTYRWVVLGV